MTFSPEQLSLLCRNFCEEMQAITHESDQFLAQFHTEERVRFSDVAKIKARHLEPYSRLLTSLLASLEKSDALALRLSALLASADCPDAIEHMPRIEALFSAYEQYRAQVSEYLAQTQRYWTDKDAMGASGTAPLVQATRTLIGAQRQALAAFSQGSQ